MLELLGPAMSITTAALLAQSSLLKTALDASIIHNAARLRNTNLSNTGYEWPPLARSSRSHRTVMEWLLVAQSGHSYANSTSRLIRNKRPYQLGIRLGGGGATALTFRLAIRTANALLREKP
jgi:hypothetical protein